MSRLASARIRIFSSMDRALVVRLGGIPERLWASCSQRESVCCGMPVSRPSCRALTPSLPVSRSSILCLYASENGLVTSLSLPRPQSSFPRHATTILAQGAGQKCYPSSRLFSEPNLRKSTYPCVKSRLRGSSCRNSPTAGVEQRWEANGAAVTGTALPTTSRCKSRIHASPLPTTRVPK